jgi:thymidylate kinase
MMISFSGIDSSGKSTYIEYLVKNLKENNVKHKVIWSRGGYTSWFELFKKLVRSLSMKKLPQSGHSEKRTEMFQKGKVRSVWINFAILDLIRLYTIEFRLLKFLGYTIICDRYIWDTLVDFSLQFPDVKLEKNILWRILIKTYKRPDVDFFLYVTPEVSLERSIQKNEAFSESLEQRKVRIEKYLELQSKGKWKHQFNTEESKESVWARMVSVVKNVNS